MSEMEGVSYAVFAVYVLTSAGLAAAAAKLGGTPAAQVGIRSTVEKFAGAAVLITFAGAGVWPLLRAALGEPLHPDPVQTALDGLAGDLAGHLILVLGALFAMTAQMHGDTARRKDPSLQVVDSGPYAISRHPVALGRVVMTVGLFLVFPGVAQGAFALVHYAVSEICIRRGEHRFANEIGAPYAAYMRRAPRWLGRPRSRHA